MSFVIKRPAILVFFSIVLCLSGCGFSFHSNQYNAIKSLSKSISSVKKAPESAPYNWDLVWDDTRVSMLAVDVGNETWFVGGTDLIVKFDGWQITGVENLFPGDAKIRLQLEDNILSITHNELLVATYSCNPWVGNPSGPEKALTYYQVCSDDNLNFRNQITLDSARSVSELVFTAHPNYPSLRLSAK